MISMPGRRGLGPGPARLSSVWSFCPREYHDGRAPAGGSDRDSEPDSPGPSCLVGQTHAVIGCRYQSLGVSAAASGTVTVLLVSY